jgi:hypothetical protein
MACDTSPKPTHIELQIADHAMCLSYLNAWFSFLSEETDENNLHDDVFGSMGIF